jgi:hypothetical protein
MQSVLALRVLLVQRQKYCKSKNTAAAGATLAAASIMRYLLYLLYWYNSTNNDAAGASATQATRSTLCSPTLLALLVQKHTY